MPYSEIQPVDYLTKRGRKIFQLVVKHLKDTGVEFEIDVLELTMLANSMDLYESAAKRVNDKRTSEIDVERARAYGEAGKLSADYQVMQKEYKQVLAHGSKFGLNPGDRAKIFGGMKAKKKKDVSDGLEDEPLRIAQ